MLASFPDLSDLKAHGILGPGKELIDISKHRMLYGGFLKWWYPTTMGFPTKNDHLEIFVVFWGYHHLRKHPYVLDCIFLYLLLYIYIPANRDVRRPSNAPLTRFRALFAGTSFGFWTLFFAFFVASRASVHT